jgi:hypothetical protein
MELPGIGFIRRFGQHILPHRFTKIRSYGYLSNRGLRERINQMPETMELPKHPRPIKVPRQVRLPERYGKQANKCPPKLIRGRPCCHQPSLQLLTVVYPKARIKPSG